MTPFLEELTLPLQRGSPEKYQHLEITRTKGYSFSSEPEVDRQEIYCSIHCGLPNIINFAVWFLLRNKIPSPYAGLKQ